MTRLDFNMRLNNLISEFAESDGDVKQLAKDLQLTGETLLFTANKLFAGRADALTYLALSSEEV
jgi:hypothetical protein